MSANPSSRRKHLFDIVILLSLGLPVLFICVMVFIISYCLSTPPAPTPAPSEIAARARARDAHVAAAKTQTPGLVKETGVITLPLGQSANWAVVYFDGVRLWASLERQLIALDPEAREVLLGPIELMDPAFGMSFVGQRLWVSDIAGLYPVDVESGQRGTAIQVFVNPYTMVYDGAHTCVTAHSDSIM